MMYFRITSTDLAEYQGAESNEALELFGNKKVVEMLIIPCFPLW